VHRLSQLSSPLTSPLPPQIQVQNIIGDSAPDLIFTSGTSVYLQENQYTSDPDCIASNNGASSGCFAAPQLVATCASDDAVWAKGFDMDGDDCLDLLYVCGGTEARIATMAASCSSAGSSAGTNTGWGAALTKAGPDNYYYSGITKAEMVDMDGDGVLDIVGVSNVKNSKNLFVLKGSQCPGCDIQFVAQHFSLDGNVGRAMSDFVIADFDKDGWLDVFAVDMTYNTLYYVLGNNDLGGSAYNWQSTTTNPVRVAAAGTDGVDAPGNLVAMDIDADGDVDIVFTCDGSSALHVLENLYVSGGAPENLFGTATWSADTNDAWSAGTDGKGLAVADFNGDGKVSPT
jgi:hypothetical protein